MIFKRKGKRQNMQDEKNINGNEQEVTENAAAEKESAENQQGAGNAVQEMQEKYLRLYADFENFRRRSSRERADLIQSANRDLILQILPVYDDLERALSVLEKADGGSAAADGVKLIFNKFGHVLHQAGVKEIEAIGQPFDPEMHDAITQIPAPAPDMKGKVIDQVQKGYMLNDKIIRHSKVVVAE